ncbi:MAG: PorP/SprF family type IX secretion system membrane protein [Psychroflexus halocasei]
MTIHKNPFVLLLILFTISLTAQERGLPIYKDYLTDNYYLIHPSMAGASSENKIRLTGRQQWFDVDDAPALYTASINGRIGENVGIGGILFKDSNGRFSQQGALATFAYHIPFSNVNEKANILSFGMNLGFSQEKLDESDLSNIENPDPIITGVEQTDAYFNLDFGISYLYGEFFLHATVKNIMPQERKIFTDVYETDNQRQYLASFGYTFNRDLSKWSFEPSLMYHYKDETAESNIDVNFKAYYMTPFGNFWGGLSYRRAIDAAEFNNASGKVETADNYQNLSPFVGVTYDRFMFAYMYTYQANSVVLSNSGFHQITLGINFGENKRRYKCNCPFLK